MSTELYRAQEPISETLHVGQLADWVLAARAQGGAPAYTPLDASRNAALRDALPKVENGRIDARLNLCLAEIEQAKLRYAEADADLARKGK